MKPTRYTDPNRLADVMALIQVLAQGPHAMRTEQYLKQQLRGIPTSGPPTWMSLAGSHREFFRVRPPDEQHKEGDVALIWRHALQVEENDLQEGKRPPLSPESIAKLLEIAVSLHDRDVTRRQRLHYLIPIATAIIAGLFSILILLLQVSSRVSVSK
jgi:hypothetical protein